MSSFDASNSIGVFGRESFPELLQAVAARRLSGQLSLEAGAQRATLYFIQGRLAAAELGQVSGALAFQYAAGCREGRYQFTESFVQLSQLSTDKRIHQTLEALLELPPLTTALAPSSIPLERSLDKSPAAEQPAHSAQTRSDRQPSQAVALDAFDFDALNGQVMRPGYLDALMATFVRSVGPAGYVLFDDIAQDAGIDLRSLSQTKAVKLSAALLAQLPVAQRTAFQIASAAQLEQFKP